MLSEFKPALKFLGKFLAIYLMGNILYGVFIESLGKRVDGVTESVTQQVAASLRCIGYNANTEYNIARPTIKLKNDNTTIVSVFEGCNGINVMIVFVAFLFAFGGPVRNLAWFLPLGILIIHLVNLMRLSLLYVTAIHQPQYFYYLHKYFFTAILYLVVFVLWTIWVAKFNVKTRQVTQQ